MKQINKSRSRAKSSTHKAGFDPTLPNRNFHSSPSFQGLRPSSVAASSAKKRNGSKDTLHEMLLRKTLWNAGFRYRKNVSSLPGKPDLVFLRQKVVVFCDGDFWHGRDWKELRVKLRGGHNAEYWISKVEGNRKRDLVNKARLESAGWAVLRFWETDIKASPSSIVETIRVALEGRTLSSG
jgi:DNA mismatch endonuclease (patch repair protein)